MGIDGNVVDMSFNDGSDGDVGREPAVGAQERLWGICVLESVH